MTSTLPYADARSCKEWLNDLPLTNVGEAQARLLDNLRAFPAAGPSGLERLKCLELMRDKVAFLLAEQRSRYFGKQLPLTPPDEHAWNQGRLLLEAMEAGYRQALAESAADPELRHHGALIAHRIVRYLGAQMLLHQSLYRRFDPALWTRLHRQYAEAEAQGLALDRVKDSLEADEAGSCVAEAYAHVVLVQATYLPELTAGEVEFVEALARLWARKVAVRRGTDEGTLPPGNWPLVVDFGKSIGARPLAPREVTAHHRVLDVQQVSASLRRRIHALRKDEDVASLKLPAHAPGLDVLHHLERLHGLWCEGAPPRPPARVPEEKSAAIAFGFAEIHFFLTGGKVFEQPDRARELTRQEKQDIEVFGRVTERTQSLRLGEMNFVLDEWGVIDEMLGAWRLMRPGDAKRGAGIGRLVAIRLAPGGAFLLGSITALSQETDGHIVATVTLFPGKPEPVAVRPDSRGRAMAKWVEGFRLPALPRLNIPESVVVPTGLVARGRSVELWEGEARTRNTGALLLRGADFDRVALG